MADAALVIFSLVAILAIGLAVTLYRVLPCWLKGETVRPEAEQPKET